MTTLQKQVFNKVSLMTDDNARFILELISRLTPEFKTDEKNAENINSVRIGVAENMDWYSPEYDFDEANNEIAKMFGV